MAEVAAHEEQKMLVGVPPWTTVDEEQMDEERKMLQIEDAEQYEQADDSLSDDDVVGIPLDLRALDNVY
eukprot:COSAG05_NODE_4642_length_1427_cov_2.470633_3_plen_69_part_00